MDLARLKNLLPPAVAAQVEVLWRRFAARRRDGDINDFVASLHADGHIDADQLREILASLDVSLTVADIAAPNTRPKLLGLLGRGAMGEVFIGRDPNLRRNVAIKRMDNRFAANPLLVSRFANEAQITAQLDHPGIIPVYGLEPQDDGALAYSMKLIRGRTLKQLLGELRALAEKHQRPPAELNLRARLEIFLQVCNAVSHAHTRGVMHRDLKPDNIMVGAFGEVILMDWGIARLLDGYEPVTPESDVGGHAERTQYGLAIGTPRYMSPEQAQGRNDRVDARSDQYALGLILFELVTLKPARVGKKAVEVIEKAASGKLEPLTSVDPREKVPRELAAIIRRATAYDANNRYKDVAALAEDVRRYLRDEPVLAQPDTVGQRLARWVSRNRQTVLSLGAGLVLLVLLTAALGVAAALGVREVSRQAAEAREERLAAIAGATSGGSRRMESAFLRYEGLLQGLAGVAETRLTEPPAPRKWYSSEVFTIPGLGPPDLVRSDYYDVDISAAEPDVVFAPGVDRKAAEQRVLQVTSLAPVFADVHRRSGDNGPNWATLMKDGKLPIVWSYVATEEGFLVGYPGCGVYPEAYDPRAEHWYTATVPTVGPHWEPAYYDESGMGLLITATRSLRDRTGKLLGVAAVDITVAWVIDNFLEAKGLAAPTKAWLVDADGNVVVRSDFKEESRDLREWAPPPFPYSTVILAMRQSPEQGHVEVDGQLFAWSALPTLGWTYVISGDAKALLGE
jgi:serine/threonine-protein kinase